MKIEFLIRTSNLECAVEIRTGKVEYEMVYSDALIKMLIYYQTIPISNSQKDLRIWDDNQPDHSREQIELSLQRGD